MGSMARAAVAAALVVVGLASVATAQMDSCNGELPPVLVANYSGLACQPVWNNFVLRVLSPGQEQRPACSPVHDVQHGVGGHGFLEGRPHDRLQRHGGVDRQEGSPPHPAVRAARQDQLQGGRRPGLPRLQRPRPHCRRAAGQDPPRLPAQVLLPPHAPAHHHGLREQHPREEQAHQAPGHDLLHLRLHHRQSFCRRIIPLRLEACPWRAQRVRLGRPDAHRRHPCALLPADGPALVLPPRRPPVRRVHHRPRRRRGRCGAVQQDPGRHPGAQRPRHLRPLPWHPADLGLLPAAERGLQVPQVLELVPPLGGAAGALLRVRQHRARDPRRRRRQLVEDRLRLQPGRHPHRRHRAGVHAVDEVVQEQHLHPDVLKAADMGGGAVMTALVYYSFLVFLFFEGLMLRCFDPVFCWCIVQNCNCKCEFKRVQLHC